MVDVKCTSCGGVMRLNVAQQAADCPFCGSKMLLDGASLGQLDAASRGDVLLELREYQRAAEAYEEAVNTQPQDYRSWRGRLYLFLAGQNADFASVPKDAENMMRLLPPEQRETALAGLRPGIDAAVAGVRSTVQGFFAFVQQQEQMLNAQSFAPQTPMDLADIQQRKRQWAMSNGSWLAKRGWLLLVAVPLLWFLIVVFGAFFDSNPNQNYFVFGLLLFILLPLAFVAALVAFIVARTRHDKSAQAEALAAWQVHRRRQWIAVNITGAPQAQPVKSLEHYIYPLAMLCLQCAPEYVPELERYSQDLLNYNVLV